MLQIKNVTKTYHTGSLTQRALAGVSLNLRDSEFVAVLGASGSGKTTLLNVIGGLDRYDEGDLVINGKSTKKYKSRDWDAYRNHSVGFVFQSYNLIPHQSVLANVELALTIGGVSKKERTARARDALTKVGLSEHIHKKPSQLSGGQMQRVAIARALVNDPDILLADEPTGALDSETSIQVMDLLKEVASDRLVVMVTHNPELAERYATRIVRLKDGKITSDTDPFEPDEAPQTHISGRAGMSFLTALNLSLKNLWTKKVRTLLVAFAGSIGIIGIAMILSMSHGANLYIKNIQEETLKSYPLQITRTSFDLSSIMTPRERQSGDDSAEVREWRAVTSLFSHVATNDLASLAEYFESGKTKIYDYVQAIEYDYNVTPQIYTLRDGKIRQVNPDRTFASLGFSATDTMSSLMTSFSGTSSFYAMPSDPDLYEGGFDVKAGRWPENCNECVLVLSENGFIADLTLYTLGLKDPADLDEMIKAFAEGYAADVDSETMTYKYEDFLGIKFKLISSADKYVYDSDHDVWTDRSEDEKFMTRLVEAGEDLTVVGVVQPNEDNDNPTMNVGIAYPASLTLHVIDVAAKSDIVKAQLASHDVDIFTGTEFGKEAERGAFDLSSLFTVDEEAFKKVFNIDLSALTDGISFDPSAIDLSSIDLSGTDLSSLLSLTPDLSGIDLSSLLSKIKIKATAKDVGDLLGALLAGFAKQAVTDPSSDYTKLADSIASFLSSGKAREVISEGIYAALEENGAGFVTFEDLSELTKNVMAGFPDYFREREADGAAIGEILSDYFAKEDVRAVITDAAASYRAKLSGFILKEEQSQKITSDLYAAYIEYAKENALPDPTSITEAFVKYLASDEATALIADRVSAMIDTSELESAVAEEIGKYTGGAAPKLEEAIKSVANGLMTKLSGALSDAVQSAASGIFSSLEDAFSFDPEALASAFSINMTPEELRDMMTSLLTTEVGSYDTNLKKLGYADTSNPTSITIYPADFAGKTEIKNIIENYNDEMKAAGEDDKVIVYTDLVDTLMSSVTDIIDAISYVLIAFVAISLVVSSVMIGVITYISVLERKKEIGILRAIGASRRNVSNVFNAETFIIGALAGVLGILITLVLLIPANYAIHALSGQNDINAILPPVAAVLLILLSIALTLIGGIIPSRKAAKSDPVEALRSE